MSMDHRNESFLGLESKNRVRVEKQLQRGGASKCAHETFVLQLLSSTDENCRDIAECIVLGECELSVALSKIDRALTQTQDNPGCIETRSVLRLYKNRITNALSELQKTHR